MSEQAPVRVGVLGCAGIARRRMLPALAAAAGTEVTAVASRDADKARRTADQYGCAAFTGYEALLESDDVDAVYVPLPIALHAEWVEAALRTGRHVLAEKPLTADPATTERLLALAGERGLVLMENVLFVHHPQHTAVRKLVADGEIGELRTVNATFAIPELPPDDIRYRPELGGGALLDVGLYPVRAALHLLGGGLRVAGAVLHRDAERRVETSGAALLQAPDGVIANVTFGIGHAYRSAYELCGSKGRIRVEHTFTPPADHRPVLLVEHPGATTPVVLDAHDQVAAAVEAFATAVRTGGPGTAGPVDAEACREQARLLADIRDIATSGAAAGPAPGEGRP
ncbi:Gfo/Idh/MocA family protein [Streptomyces rimosus]|uniref:Gfo/Idh/MocA family protein n=1 Tax=Streptomyces rimosus TaxID=1927 RepID=UPI00067B6547|nr:Gfo/Idh/MocA family oxidoreductase [Streptomyces rimosus]